jgi:hypothetical protein
MVSHKGKKEETRRAESATLKYDSLPRVGVRRDLPAAQHLGYKVKGTIESATNSERASCPAYCSLKLNMLATVERCAQSHSAKLFE